MGAELKMAEEEATPGFLLEIWEARYRRPRPREALSSEGRTALEAIRAAVAAPANPVPCRLRLGMGEGVSPGDGSKPYDL